MCNQLNWFMICVGLKMYLLGIFQVKDDDVKTLMRSGLADKVTSKIQEYIATAESVFLCTAL